MAAPETFDPKRYTPFEIGVPVGEDPLHVPGDRHGRGQHQDLAGAGARRAGAGPGDADPLARRRRPGEHPPLAAPVSLAHRLRPAADGGRAASRVVDRQGARARGTRRSRRSSTSASGWKGYGESEELKAFTTAGFFGSEFGPFNLPYPLDAIAAVRPPQGDDPRAVRAPRADLSSGWSSRARSASWPATIIRSRCSGRWTTPTGCSTRPSATRST